MPGKRLTPEQIIGLLRQAEVELAQGRTVGEVCRGLGVSEASFYRWRSDYGGLKVDQARRMKKLERENARLKRPVAELTLDKQILREAGRGKIRGPERRRACVRHVRAALCVSERRACRALGQLRSTPRRMRRVREDEAALTEAIVALAAEYGRYGYRRITATLRAGGWRVNAKRVQRIWPREGLRVPKKQPKRGRLWLNDGSCIRLRPCWPGHVRAYNLVQDRTSGGRPFRMLTIIDEYTRECLAIVVARRLTSDDVLQVLTDLFVERGPPDHIRSDNGGEFTARIVRAWLERIGVRTLFIERGSPWENGYNESFDGKLRDELLDREIFHTLHEAMVLIERWRRYYNTLRPQSALGHRPPAPEATLPHLIGPAYAALRHAQPGAPKHEPTLL
ncbi:IS3 family transposase [Roseomonas sp. GCM10028921]